MPRFVALVVALVAGCGSTEEAAGGAYFAASAGASVESDTPPLATADGWTLHFDRFAVAFHDLSLRSGQSAAVATLLGSRLVDLKAVGAKRIITFENLPAGSYDRVGWRIAPVNVETEVGAGATGADRALMSGKWSIYVEGTATSGAVTKYFRWGVGTDAAYDCKGVTVNDGATTAITLTLDAGRLFGDFAPLAAADADGDQIVTLEELGAAGLSERLATAARTLGVCP